MKNQNILIFITFVTAIAFTQSSYCSEGKKITISLYDSSIDNPDILTVDSLLDLAYKTSWIDIKSSEQYTIKALKLSQNLRYKKGIAYAKYNLAKLFANSEYDFAESLVVESLTYARSVDDSILMAKGYNALGSLKGSLNQYEDALLYVNKSLDIYLRLKMDSLAAGVYNNLGLINLAIPVNKDSINYFLKAAEINKKTNNYVWLAINYVNMAEGFISTGKLDEGYHYLHLSLGIANKHSFDRLFPWIYNNLSYYYKEIENYEEAINCANKSLSMAKNQGNWIQELKALILLKEVNYLIPNIYKAYEFSEQVKTVTDSINKYSRLKELDFLELRYRFEEEQKQYKLETALLEIKIYNNRLKFILIILLSAIMIFILLVKYITQSNKVKRKNLEKKNILLENEKLISNLEFKSKELTTTVMYLLKKNEFISSISNKLKTISNDSMGENATNLNQIIVEIEKRMTDTKWDEFEKRFQDVHVGFYKKLSIDFPNLSPKELRLSAFLRLNMTSKEIADITFQSINSLKTSRHRLRKKLNLSREENLIAFLTKY